MTIFVADIAGQVNTHQYCSTRDTVPAYLLTCGGRQ